MSGPLTVPLAVAAVFVQSSWLKVPFVVLAVACGGFACYWVWREERLVRTSLQDRLKPRLVFVIEECCRRQATLARVGVANTSPVSVEDARVYITIPSLQIDDRVLTWAGMKPDEGWNLHPGPRSSHAHTAPFVLAGDQPGRFFIQLGYGAAQPIEPGRHTGELCVKGRNVTATTAQVEFTCTLPWSLTMRLVTRDRVLTENDQTT